MSKFKDRLADWAEAIAVLLGLAELRDEAKLVAENVFARLSGVYDLLLVWYQHNVMARVKKVPLVMAAINAAILAAALLAVRYCCGLPAAVTNNASKVALWFVGMGVVVPLVGMSARLWLVKPVDWSSFFRDQNALTREEFERRWGPTKPAWLATLAFLIVGGFFANAGCIALMAMWFGTFYDVDFYRLLPLIFLTAAALGGGILFWVLFKAVIENVIVYVGGLINQIFNALMSEIVIASTPGITDKNVGEKIKALATEFAKPIGKRVQESDVTAFFGLALVFASFALYPNLFVVSGVILILLVGFATDHAQSGRGKMDTLPWIQKSLASWARVFGSVAVWRLIELILLAVTGRWIAMNDLINIGISWVNALMLSGGWGVLIIAIAGIVYASASGAKDASKASKIVKYASAIAVLAVVIGWFGTWTDHRMTVPVLGRSNGAANSAPTKTRREETAPPGNMVGRLRGWAATNPQTNVPAPVVVAPATTVDSSAPTTDAPARRRPTRNRRHSSASAGSAEGMTPEFAEIARQNGYQ